MQKKSDGPVFQNSRGPVTISRDDDCLEFRIPSSMRHPQKRAFLRAYARVGKVGMAAQAAGVNRNTPERWKQDDPEFLELFEQATEAYIEFLEHYADVRATVGLTRLKFNKDGDALIDPRTNDVYEEQVCSDNLLMFRLKALAPHKYRDLYVPNGGSDGEAVRIIFAFPDRPRLPGPDGVIRCDDLIPALPPSNGHLNGHK